MSRILMRLVANILTMLFRALFYGIQMLLGCGVRLLYWSVRTYGWGRVMGVLGSIVISIWINFLLVPFARSDFLVWSVPIGALCVWGTGRLLLEAGRHAWRHALTGGLSPPLTRSLAPSALNTTATQATISLRSGVPPPAGELWDRLVAWPNLEHAWQRVSSNGGSPGPDGISVEAFGVNWQQHLRELVQELMQWRYRPTSPRLVEIPKRQGGMRRLAIFSLRDRIVQHALNQVLMPLWNPRFAPCSYAYRPGRSAQQAVEAVEKGLKDGMHWVLDADIERFFDSVPHTRLLPLVQEWTPDDRIFSLLQLVLMSGSDSGLGLPQGSAISPILANLYLHPFDEALLQQGHRVHRYADDFVVLCATQTQAEEAYRSVQRLLETLQLRLNMDKTRIVHQDQGFTFLGFTFDAQGKRPSDEAVNSLRTRLESAKDREQRERIQTGWHAYFGRGTRDKGLGVGDQGLGFHRAGPVLSASQQNRIPSANAPIVSEYQAIDDLPWFDEPEQDSSDKGTTRMTVSHDGIELYLARFIGRRDVFAQHWRNDTGRQGYVPVRRPITQEDVEAHLAGEAILGTYLLRQDGRTSALVFDVDGPTLDEAGRQAAHRLAERIDERLCKQGIGPLLMDSGGKGRHLWLCLEHPAPAAPLRAWADHFLDRFRPFPDGVLVEVFPKQEFLSGDALGSLLRLPFGRHPQTGRIGQLLDTSGHPLPDPFVTLAKMPLIAPDLLVQDISTAEPQQIPEPPPAIIPMMQGCTLLRTLVRKAAQQGQLKHTERLALLYTLGHCGDAGHSYLHQIMELCANYDARTTARWIARVDPGHKSIRCKRLQEWLKDYLPGVKCDCSLKGSNPRPLDWLRREKPSNQPKPARSTVPEEDWDGIAEDLFASMGEE